MPLLMNNLSFSKMILITPIASTVQTAGNLSSTKENRMLSEKKNAGFICFSHFHFKVETSTVQQAEGMSSECLAARYVCGYVSWGGRVAPPIQTTGDVLGSDERQTCLWQQED